MRIIKKIDWSSPDLLPKNLILIDGITRSGKSLVGPIVGSLNKVYPMQHQALLDNLIVEITNAVMFIIINEFSFIYEVRKNFYRSNFLSLRNVERFRNNLSWETPYQDFY